MTDKNKQTTPPNESASRNDLPGYRTQHQRPRRKPTCVDCGGPVQILEGMNVAPALCRKCFIGEAEK